MQIQKITKAKLRVEKKSGVVKMRYFQMWNSNDYLIIKWDQIFKQSWSFVIKEGKIDEENSGLGK